VIGTRHACACAAVVAVACALLACGGGGPREAVVIRVGDAGIKNATIAHWMSVMAPQHVLPIPPHYAACISQQRKVKPQSSSADVQQTCRREYQAVRQQALSFLISSRWLTGEAAEQGVGVSAREIDQRLQQKERSFPSKSEFEESLKAIAHTVDDVRLELGAELAGERLRRRLIDDEPKPSPSEIAAEYRRHIRGFHIPERRYFDIAENFHSAAAARRQMREAEAGKHLASLQETLPRKSFSDYNGEKRIIYEAIFKARLHVVTGPIRLNHFYFLIRVTRIVPAHVESLAQVSGEIEKKLNDERRRRSLAAFVAAWRKKWTARTDCDAGYVVQKCRTYAGPKTLEEPLALN
jgi:foldase protein PrsA